jgi:formate hydrogenlyase transcriptional activator
VEEFYAILALLTVGVAISMGSISFFIGFQNKGKTDLIFGWMALSLVIFFLLPPVGFIVHDQPPYPTSILIKRIFIYSYYALIPVFIAFYTGYNRRKPIYFIGGLIIVGYVMMFMTTIDRSRPLWSLISVSVFGSILAYGLAAAVWQYRTGERVKARWLLVSMAIYGVLFLLTAINQLSFMQNILNMKLFYPMHFHSILFMLIMGLRVVVDVLEKQKLEKTLKDRDNRWQAFMQHAPVMVLEMDTTGKIVYINEYGVRHLGFKELTEVRQTNWFDKFLPADEAGKVKANYEQMMREERPVPYFKNTVRNRYGKESIMSWVNYITYSPEGKVFGCMSVGRDVTEQESAQRLVDQLRKETEKVKIAPSDIRQFSEEMIGTSEAIHYAIQKALQVAPTSAPVLLEGETGVGKDLLADIIHRISLRNEMAMVKVNCGALPKELIEDELFGHEKGAFTSAIQQRKGRFELADGGTIFLDEIGELPLEMQPKLLRVLQNGEFERVGGQKTIKVQVRVIAATNRDLALEVKRGNFRDDLFYRLNVFPITIPPLRKRKEDLPTLIHYFIGRKAKKYCKQVDEISKADLERMIDYSWPGNVRELENIIERSMITSEGTTLNLDWFFAEQRPETTGDKSLEQIEKLHIVKILNECHWRINGEGGAAEKLAMHPNTLRSKMKKLQIHRPDQDAHEMSTIRQPDYPGER